MKNLLICNIGAMSLHRNLQDEDRKYTLACIGGEGHSVCGPDGGLNFAEILKEIISEGHLSKYERFCFAEDGIVARTSELNRLFGMMENLGIRVLVPAVAGGCGADEFMAPQRDTELRFTDWAEAGCILMDREYLEQVMELFEDSYNSEGPVQRMYRHTGIPFCIADSVPVIHSGKNGASSKERSAIGNEKGAATGKTVFSHKLKNIISFVAIFKSEDRKRLAEMLASLPAGSEVVLVETIRDPFLRGLSAIQSNGSRIYAKYYYGEFSYCEARNAAKTLATKPVVFSIDADERLLPHQHGDILSAALELERSSFAGLQVRNVSVIPSVENAGVFGSSMTQQVRMFRNLPRLEWKGTVHETIDQSMIEQGLVFGDSNIIIHHTGYEGSAGQLAAKAEARLKMLIRGGEALTEKHYFDYIISEAHNYRTFQSITGGSHGA